MDGKSSLIFEVSPLNEKLLAEKKIPELVPAVYFAPLEQLINNCIPKANDKNKVVIIYDNPDRIIPEKGKSLREFVGEKANKSIFFLTVEESNGLLAKVLPDVYGSDLFWINVKDGNVQIDFFQVKTGYSTRNVFSEVHIKRLAGQHKLNDLTREYSPNEINPVDFPVEKKKNGKLMGIEEMDENQIKALRKSFSQTNIWSLLFGTQKTIQTHFILLSLSPLQPNVFNQEEWWCSLKEKEEYFEDYYLITRKELSSLWPNGLQRFVYFFTERPEISLCLHGKHHPKNFTDEVLLKKFFDIISTKEFNTEYIFKNQNFKHIDQVLKSKKSSLSEVLQSLEPCITFAKLKNQLSSINFSNFNKDDLCDEIFHYEVECLKIWRNRN